MADKLMKEVREKAREIYTRRAGKQPQSDRFIRDEKVEEGRDTAIIARKSLRNADADDAR